MQLAERETVVIRRDHERYAPALVVHATPSTALVVLGAFGRVGRYALLLPAYVLVALGAFGRLMLRELEAEP